MKNALFNLNQNYGSIKIIRLFNLVLSESSTPFCCRCLCAFTPLILIYGFTVLLSCIVEFATLTRENGRTRITVLPGGEVTDLLKKVCRVLLLGSLN